MKTLRKLSFIIFIPIILGIVLIIAGSGSNNAQVTHAGEMILSIGIPVTMFIVFVIGLVMMITGKTVNDNSNTHDEMVGGKANGSERESELSEIEDVNSSYGYESQRRQGEYYMRQTAKAYKNATPKEKILGGLFLGFLLTDFALIMVFAFFRIMVGAIICFCSFGGTILLCLIVTKIREHMSMKAKLDIANSKILCGEVKACLMSSSTSTGGGDRHNSTTRITGVIYRVVISAEGKEYTAYSKKFYETGESVVFAVRGNKGATIIDNEKFMQETDEILSKSDDEDTDF
ncbi:MAG: hypothetical protein K2I23_07010 [Clostridia bacterium]|nr:hypothetical protein [Clostridia bacterium]